MEVLTRRVQPMPIKDSKMPLENGVKSQPSIQSVMKRTSLESPIGREQPKKREPMDLLAIGDGLRPHSLTNWKYSKPILESPFSRPHRRLRPLLRLRRLRNRLLRKAGWRSFLNL